MTENDNKLNVINDHSSSTPVFSDNLRQTNTCEFNVNNGCSTKNTNNLGVLDKLNISEIKFNEVNTSSNLSSNSDKERESKYDLNKIKEDLERNYKENISVINDSKINLVKKYKEFYNRVENVIA